MLPAGDNEFEGQSEQVGPNPGLYLFILHGEHEVPFFPAYPALHSQEVFVILPAGETEFDGQSVHSADPRLPLYLPDTQA